MFWKFYNLVQRPPDQTRAFLRARGFGAAQAERIAQSCVFQATFRDVQCSPDAHLAAEDLK